MENYSNNLRVRVQEEIAKINQTWKHAIRVACRTNKGTNKDNSRLNGESTKREAKIKKYKEEKVLSPSLEHEAVELS